MTHCCTGFFRRRLCSGCDTRRSPNFAHAHRRSPALGRPCENNSTRRRGARLIRAGCYLRNKDSSRHYVRFFYCAFTTFRGVFTQPVMPGVFVPPLVNENGRQLILVGVRFWLAAPLVDATQALNLSAGLRIPRSCVVVR